MFTCVTPCFKRCLRLSSRCLWHSGRGESPQLSSVGSVWIASKKLSTWMLTSLLQRNLLWNRLDSRKQGCFKVSELHEFLSHFDFGHRCWHIHVFCSRHPQRTPGWDPLCSQGQFLHCQYQDNMCLQDAERLKHKMFLIYSIVKISAGMLKYFSFHRLHSALQCYSCTKASWPRGRTDGKD